MNSKFNKIYNNIILEFGGNTPESKFKWKFKRQLYRLFGNKPEVIDNAVNQVLKTMKEQFEANIGKKMQFEKPNSEYGEQLIKNVEYPYVFVQTNNHVFKDIIQTVKWNIGMCMTNNGLNKLKELAAPYQQGLQDNRRKQKESLELQKQRKIDEQNRLMNSIETKELMQIFKQRYEDSYYDYIYDGKQMPSEFWNFIQDYASKDPLKNSLKGFTLILSKRDFTPDDIDYADHPQYSVEKARADKQNSRNMSFVQKIRSFI